jgi:hypothetical protein
MKKANNGWGGWGGGGELNNRLYECTFNFKIKLSTKLYRYKRSVKANFIQLAVRIIMLLTIYVGFYVNYRYC